MQENINKLEGWGKTTLKIDGLWLATPQPICFIEQLLATPERLAVGGGSQDLENWGGGGMLFASLAGRRAPLLCASQCPPGPKVSLIIVCLPIISLGDSVCIVGVCWAATRAVFCSLSFNSLLLEGEELGP